MKYEFTHMPDELEESNAITAGSYEYKKTTTRKCAVVYDTTALSAIRDIGSQWWRPLVIYV